VKSPKFPKGNDKAVGVVIGALLLTVILFAFLTAYILYYVPSTEQANASSSITDRENGFIGLSQGISNAPNEGSYVSQVVPLGYSGVPPFSQPSSSSISYQNNTSLFSGYLNYTFNVSLDNSTLSQTLSPNEIAVLPISISVPANEPRFFNVKLSIDSSAYSEYENANLTNILFMYSNGTVIPSWLENNASSTDSSSIYWLKLNSASSGTTINAEMVFLPIDINIMNKYQTGEAPQCSPIYGEYNDIANVLSPGLEYQIYYDSSGTVNSRYFQNSLYSANMNNGTTITEYCYIIFGNYYCPVYLTSSTPPFNTSITGITSSVNGINENNVIINNQSGYKGGNNYPNPPVSNPSNSFLIKMIGFAEINTTSTVIYGATDDGMAVGYNTYTGSANGQNWLGEPSNPNNLINSYQPQGFTKYHKIFNSINGTYPIEMDYFQCSGSAYTALWSSSPITYYHPIFPASGLVPTVALGKVSLYRITTVPITITNTQDQSEPHTYQQNITVNNALFSKYESGSLQNIIFTYQNGTIIPSWLESGNTNTSSSSIYWLSMYGLPALASEKISMILLPKYMNLMNNFRTGENPALSPIYGEYDDGSAVFVDYYSGSSHSKWTFSGSSGVITAPAGSPGGIEAFYAASANGDYLYTNASYNPSSDYIIQYYVYTTGLGDFFFSSSASGHAQMSRLDSRSGCNDLGLASTSSWTSWNAPVGHATLPRDKWYLFSIVIANGKIADYQNSNLNSYSKLGTNINPLSSTYKDSGGTESYDPLGSYIGLVGDALGASYDTYWNGIIIRDYPSNGVMPSVTFSAANTSSSNNSILHFSENYKIYGALSSVLNLGSSNSGTIYLVDGSTVLSNGNQNFIKSILPVNLTQSRNGIGLSVNAVSILGKNQTYSAVGSSIVKLEESNAATTTFYVGEVLSLLSPSFVPYTADVISINISSFSYVISGPMGSGLNSSLYLEYGQGQTVGSNNTWFIDNNFYVTYNSGFLKIGILRNSLQVNSISIGYRVFSLLNL
jgi:hypothetical protein